MQFLPSIALGVALIAAPAAFAQTTPQTPPAAAAPAANGPVSDQEVDQFVTAAMAAEKVRTDAAIPEADKTGKLGEAITAAGLTTERFNVIATAMQSDPALAKRVQDQAATRQPAAPAK